LHKLTQKGVLKGLNQQNLDFHLLKTVNSTNTFAKDTNLNKKYLIVLSEEQTAGKGRWGNTWYSPDCGNIYMSIKFKDNTNQAPLSLLIGLLISEAMDEISGNKIHAGLKWPNDLLIENKKVCGILIESEKVSDEIELIVGIGINYALPQKESWWGDIGKFKKILPREKLINAILKKIISYKENGYPDWKAQWEKRCMHKNAEIKIISNNQKEEITGIFKGINEEGSMILQTSNGLKLINSGECSIKGIY
jgi:BirA family biotin operon repressor/biotin-[acetyl-CoA-carboxylase] ligase